MRTLILLPTVVLLVILVTPFLLLFMLLRVRGPVLFMAKGAMWVVALVSGIHFEVKGNFLPSIHIIYCPLSLLIIQIISTKHPRFLLELLKMHLHILYV